tara:strand:+ start:25 stop:453 length:429 start_codon:yes stop_codon:yes gene_type:complete
MQLHELKPKHKRKTKKRIGRGGKRGTYSGRGQKGQLSRAGRKMAPAIREIIKKYPKLRGYRNRAELEIAVINIGTLDKNFKASEVITPEVLLQKKLISRIKGKTPKVKILGQGKLTKKFIIKGCQFSKTAKEAIEKNKGEIK